jgi:hypothetical protein
MLFSVKKFSITTTIAIILTLLACGQRVENPLDNPGSGIYTAGGGLVSIDIGDGLITKESPITPLSDTFQVVLTKQPAADVTIGTIISSNTGEVVVSTASLTFTTANWDVPQTVTVTGVDDLVLDGMQTVFIDLGNTSSIDPDWDNLDLGELVVNNLDDETPTTPAVILLIGDGLITREHPTTPWSDTFNVVLNSAPASDVTINPIVSTDTGEVIVSTATLTFTTANWDVPQTITVTGVDDAAVDGMQAVTVNMGSTSSADPSWNAIAAGSVTVYNLDDESPPSPGVIVNAGSSLLVSEDGNSSSFQVVLKSQPTVNVSINVSVSDPSEGTITFPFAGANGVITFTPLNWNTPQTITVAGMDDAITDGNQPFTVVLGITSSTDPNYDSTFNPPDVSFINIDNESPGVTVNAGSSMLVSENGDTSSFDIVLNAPPTANVTINVSVDDPLEGTIIFPFAGANGIITFTPLDWDTPQTIIVSGVNDNIADGNQPFNVVLGVTASGDTNYGGIFNPPDVAFTNVDDDHAGITVNIGNGLITKEHPTTPLTDIFEVVLNSEPTANVTLNSIVSTDIGEVMVNPGTLTFTPLNWFMPQQVTVTGVDDAAVDGIISVNIDLGTATSGDPNYDAFDPGDVTVFNIDDEAPYQVIVIPDTFLITSENGGTVKLKVVLNNAPTLNVTLSTIQSLDPSEGTVSPSSLTFTPTDWNVPHEIIVTGLNDGGPGDGDVIYNIDLGTTASGDPNWNGIDPGDVSLTNYDYMYIGDYTWNSVLIPGSFIAISGTGTLISSLYWLDPQTPFSPLDEGYYIVPLGFSFNFLGKYYSQIAVYTNGFASFSNEILNFNNFANQLLFQVWPPDEFVDILAPWWEDLTVSTGNMYYRTTGVSGSRVLTIEWDTVEVIGNNETYTFQLKLYETTNIIKFIYGDKTSSGPTSTSASIGLKDDATIDPLFYWFDGIDGTIGNDATYGAINYQRSHADFPAKDTVISFTP